MNKGFNEPEIADRDFRRDRGSVSDAQLAHIESADTAWNPDKSPAEMEKYEQELLSAGGEYAKLAAKRAEIKRLMDGGMDFESARKAVK